MIHACFFRRLKDTNIIPKSIRWTFSSFYIKTISPLTKLKHYQFSLVVSNSVKTVKRVTTEYGMYRKKGKGAMHKPFNGEIYALIKKAFVEGLEDDLIRLEIAYPEKMRMVREFDV